MSKQSWAVNTDYPDEIVNEHGHLIVQIIVGEHPERDRIARLIAAAPEMYEALRLVFDVIPVEHSGVIGKVGLALRKAEEGQ